MRRRGGSAEIACTTNACLRARSCAASCQLTNTGAGHPRTPGSGFCSPAAATCRTRTAGASVWRSRWLRCMGHMPVAPAGGGAFALKRLHPRRCSDPLATIALSEVPSRGTLSTRDTVRPAQTMSTLSALTDPPCDTERSCEGQRVAKAPAGMGETVTFCDTADAVGCATVGQKVSQGSHNLELMEQGRYAVVRQPHGRPRYGRRGAGGGRPAQHAGRACRADLGGRARAGVLRAP